MKISIINGPNLNLLGRRQPEVYGSRPFDEYLAALRAARPDVGIDYFQSNSEGALIDYIQKVGFSGDCDGIVINPTGLVLEGYRLALDWIIGSRPAATE